MKILKKWGNLLTLSLQNRDESQSDKSEKTKSFIAKTKSCLWNLKQNYMAFQLPRNLNFPDSDN